MDVQESHDCRGWGITIGGGGLPFAVDMPVAVDSLSLSQSLSQSQSLAVSRDRSVVEVGCWKARGKRKIEFDRGYRPRLGCGCVSAVRRTGHPVTRLRFSHAFLLEARLF